MRFAATTTSITIIDISPSIGIRVIERGDSKGSIGAGFDVQKAYAEFDNVGFSTLTTATAYSHNRANDTGYGYHLGALYEINDNGRIGLSYHSQVVHHLTGSSTFTGLIADGLNDGPLHAQRMTAKVTLPPYTALSGYYKVKPDVAVMASAIYTQWNIFKTLKLTNIAGAAPISDFPFAEPSTTIVVLVPENYRNTWNFSVGADYYATSDITLRSGIGYDETPILNAYRNAQLPDNNRFVIALGGHYQATKAVGFDFGWSHFFINQASLNPPPQVTGAQVVNLSGNVTGGADVFGGQVVWDIV